MSLYGAAKPNVRDPYDQTSLAMLSGPTIYTTELMPKAGFENAGITQEDAVCGSNWIETT